MRVKGGRAVELVLLGRRARILMRGTRNACKSRAGCGRGGDWR
jgi:hypothetical protein